MAWCEKCLSDHEGNCLDVHRRLDYQKELETLKSPQSETCPFCGGRGKGGPYGYIHQQQHCTYCRGGGRIVV